MKRVFCTVLCFLMFLGTVSVTVYASSATTFSPDTTYTRGQIVTFLNRTLK